MNKNAFTLIEMICVISLIGIIGLTMALGLNGMKKNQNEKKQSDAYSKVKSAMNVFVSTGGNFTSTNYITRLQTLLNEELIKENEKKLCESNTTCRNFVTNYKYSLIRSNNNNGASFKIDKKNYTGIANGEKGLINGNEVFELDIKSLNTVNIEVNANNKKAIITLNDNNKSYSSSGTLNRNVALSLDEISKSITISIMDSKNVNNKTTYKITLKHNLTFLPNFSASYKINNTYKSYSLSLSESNILNVPYNTQEVLFMFNQFVNYTYKYDNLVYKGRGDSSNQYKDMYVCDNKCLSNSNEKTISVLQNNQLKIKYSFKIIKNKS